MNSEQCCKKLKLEKRYEYSSYYSQLCDFLHYPNENDKFDRKIHLLTYPLEEDSLNEKAIFSLTSEGEDYLKTQSKDKKQMIISIVTLIVSIISLIVAIISIK